MAVAPATRGGAPAVPRAVVRGRPGPAAAELGRRVAVRRDGRAAAVASADAATARVVPAGPATLVPRGAGSAVSPVTTARAGRGVGPMRNGPTVRRPNAAREYL